MKIENLNEDDTFKKLKRHVDFTGALDVYVASCQYLGRDVPIKILNESVEQELNKVGWTMEELIEESVRYRNSDCEGKYS